MYKVNYGLHARYSIRTAMVVGVILTLINHFRAIVEWDFTAQEASTWLLNFVVPFVVSFYSRVMSDRKTISNKNKIFNENTELKNELEVTRAKLDQYIEKTEKTQSEEQKRNWSSNGLTKIAKVIREHENEDEIFSHLISSLVNILDANQGGIYLLKEKEGEQVLELSAMYAYNRKKFIEKEFAIGQGLVGQCYLEKDHIHLTEIPQDYIEVTSGLGHAPPNTLFLLPLVQNEHVEGIIELGAFKPIETHEIEFLKEAAVVIASFIANHRINDQTKRLLRESQEYGEELKIKEEQMRQSVEELEATQEDMKRKESEREDLLHKLRLGIIEQNLKEISVNVELGLRDVGYEISFLTQVPPIAGMIRALDNNGFDEKGNSSYDDWKSRLINIIENLMGSKKLYSEIALLDVSNNPILSCSLDGDQTNISEEGNNYSEHFRKIRSKASDEIYFGEANIESSGVFRFIIGKPVYFNEQLRFVLFISLKTDQIMELIKIKEDPKNRYQITDSLERTLYSNVNGFFEPGLRQSISISKDYDFVITHFEDPNN